MLPTKYYRIGNKIIAVNWKIVAIVVAIWIGMILFLPGGLLF